MEYGDKPLETNLLGLELMDLITNFQGIAVSRLEEIDGRIEYRIIPKSRTEAFIDSKWFPEDRLIIVGSGMTPSDMQLTSARSKVQWKE